MCSHRDWCVGRDVECRWRLSDSSHIAQWSRLWCTTPAAAAGMLKTPRCPSDCLHASLYQWLTEPDRLTLHAIHIRKEGPQAMNRDEGSYQLKSCIRPLSWHVKFKFSSCQEPEELVPASFSDEGLWERPKRQQCKNNWLFWWILIWNVHQPNESVYW